MQALEERCGPTAGCVVLLGGNSMPAANQGADHPSGDERHERALALLVEALRILDTDDDVPELGARLQGIIDDLNERDLDSDSPN